MRSEYGKRNRVINKGFIKSKCPRCTENEDQYHVLQCKAVGNSKREFIINLHTKLQKENKDWLYKNKILRIINDIVQYFKATTNFRTTQQLIGIDKLFRGFIMKNQIGIDKTQHYNQMNKILVPEYEKYYYKIWIE